MKHDKDKKRDYFIVRAKTRFLNEPQLTAYHATLFHGVAKRPSDPADLDEISGQPLSYIYNIASHSNVTQPRTNLLLRREVLDSVTQLEQVRKTPVAIWKYVHVPFQKGDMSFFKADPRTIGSEYGEVLEKAPAVDISCESIQFFELFVPAIPPEQLGTSIALDFPGGGELEIDIVRDGFAQPKFFYCEAGIGFVLPDFESLTAWIDKDYFDLKFVSI